MKANPKAPVVIAGNKVDLRPSQSVKDLQKQMVPLMDQFKCVEICVECSALNFLNVSELFYFAQRSVLYPSAPLYNSTTHELSAECVEALRRIFLLSLTHPSGVMSEADLVLFQDSIFGSPLTPEGLRSVVESVQKYTEDGMTDEGMTLTGFLFLNTLFIQRGRLETTWAALRSFGYDDDLKLRSDIIDPDLGDIEDDQSTELTPKAIAWLQRLFSRHDLDQDGALSPEEVENLFAPTPGLPWNKTPISDIVATNEQGYVTLAGFLAYWNMLAVTSHRTVIEYLAYWNFAYGDTKLAIKITPTRRSDRRNSIVSRNVFHGLVMGSKNCGKSWLLSSFINKPHDKLDGSNPDGIRRVCNSTLIPDDDDTAIVERYLVLTEVPAGSESMYLESTNGLAPYDFVLLVYDVSDPYSFHHIVELEGQISRANIPVVIAAAKSDLDAVDQDSVVLPSEFCSERDLAQPAPISALDDDNVFFSRLASVAVNPELFLPSGQYDKTSTESDTTLNRALFVSAAVAAVAAAALAWRYFK
eukprot:TRINITY_DN9721_c0_g1_i1.p1 TRINITY_DN9721_c0_g1~~TRINITY_DN9721_c0_g1_i1.p1  ORF type:complete len:563 (-),score=108.30 TRINITY_DN9721_c0_g1_i1:4-1590(-)